MAFTYEEPKDDRPSFLHELTLLTSEHITVETMTKPYVLKVLGHTVKVHPQKDKQPESGYITVYAYSATLKGYFARTYKFRPSINTKGELFKLLQYFDITDQNGFSKLDGKNLVVNLYYSEHQDKTYNMNNNGKIYVNFKILFKEMPEQTKLPETPIAIPQPITPPSPIAIETTPTPVTPTIANANDYKLCSACGHKVSNYLEHLESGCKDFIVG